MAKRDSGPKIRDLPKETQREIQRAKAKLAAEQVKKMDAAAAIDEHRATIDKLKEG